MDKKIDLRVVKTRSNIKQAFIRLLEEKDFHDITIQNILDLALINRSTFYNHYLDKYDLAEKLIFEVKEHISSCVDERFDPSHTPDPLPSICNIYHYLFEYKRMILALYHIKTDTLHLYDDLNDFLKEKCLSYLLNTHPTHDLRQLDYYSALYAGVVLSSINWLLSYGEPSDIDHILDKTQSFLMKQTLF